MASSSSTSVHRSSIAAGKQRLRAPIPQERPPNEVIMTNRAEHHTRDSSSRQGTGKMINQYEFVRKLGRGQFGEVSVAVDVVKGTEVAIKAVKRKNPKQDRMLKLRRRALPTSPDHVSLVDNKSNPQERKIKKEIAIMKKCSHPHVVQLLEVIDDEVDEKIFIVMEYLSGGEIKWRNENNEPILRVSQVRRICRDVILGLEYLHQMGIIHRDIKPANLLWSHDRRVVKIADFGVSHLTLAHSNSATLLDSDSEAALMNENDLLKLSGTPMFIAPEILYDGKQSDAASSSNIDTLGTSATEATTPPRTSAVTPAIDIWAFGLTVYALLFGCIPFAADTEWAIYRRVKEEDWDVLETMGVDRVPTGGRHQAPQPKGSETEGHLVVDLLEGLLDKNPKTRMTMEEIKHHPWILRDMPNPSHWLQQTAIDSELSATEDETSSAVSRVHFRWPNRLTRGITSWIRNVRPQRSFRRPQPLPDGTRPDTALNDVGVTSTPFADLSRQRSIAIGVHEREREKAKYRTSTRLAAGPRNKSSVDVRSSSNNTWRASSHHAKSLESWAAGNAVAGPSGQNQGQSHSQTTVDGSGSKPRRGSAPGQQTHHQQSSSSAHQTLEALQIPARSSSSVMCSPHPHSDSVCHTPAQSPATRSVSQESQQQQQERPRSRLSMLTKWIRQSSGWGIAQSHDASTSTLPSGSTSPMSPTTPPVASDQIRLGHQHQLSQYRNQLPPTRDLTARRSEDAFHQSRYRSANQTFNLAMRAASWTEVGDYAQPPDDRTSIYSGDRMEEALDANTLLVGAGGVAQSPVPSLPSGVLSTVSSTVSLGPPVLSAAQALLQRVDGAEPPVVSDPTTQDANTLARQGQYRSHATSPLAQSLYNGSRDDIGRDPMDTYDEYDSDSSGSRMEGGRLSTSLMYQHEDEAEASEDEVPLTIHGSTARRMSASANDKPSSPPMRVRPSQDVPSASPTPSPSHSRSPSQ